MVDVDGPDRLIGYPIVGAGEEPKVEHPRFTANVSRAVNAEVSGAGIVTYLGPKERDMVTGNRPGYFLIANINSDLTGERDSPLPFESLIKHSLQLYPDDA